MKDKIIEKVETILIQLERVESKLDAMIKAMHEYDDSEYGESSFEAFMETWDEEEMERRMDIIGQNGNEGLHYNMGVENDNNNIQGNERVGEKKRNKRKYYKPKNK
jgi:hypothetical protein